MTDPHFRFGLQTQGTAGAEDFALWVALENHTGGEVALTGASFTIGTQVNSGWVSMPLTPVEPFPFPPLAPGQSLRLFLHRGAGLPLAASHPDWAGASKLYPFGAAFPWRRCHTMADLMAAELCELDVGLELRLAGGALRQLGDGILNTKLAEGRTQPHARVALTPKPPPLVMDRHGPGLSWTQKISLVVFFGLILSWFLIGPKP